MSHGPVIAGPYERAGKPQFPSGSSCITLQDVSEDTSMETPASSSGNNPSPFPFMKLAVEIRLKIYDYLLIATPCLGKDVGLEMKASKGVALEINTPYCYVGPREQFVEHQTLKKSSSNYKTCKSLNLTPQILRTCKAVHQEATSILYSANLFQFRHQVGAMASNAFMEPKARLDSGCRDFYQHQGGNWRPRELSNCSFARFLLQIGQQNAASLTRLKFVLSRVKRHKDAAEAGWNMGVVTHLLKHQVPAVRQVKICRYSDLYMPLQWDEFENGLFEPVDDGLEKVRHDTIFYVPLPAYEDLLPLSTYGRSDDYLRQLEHKFLGLAIKVVVEEITWLKVLKVIGLDTEDPAHQKIEELQALVKARR